MKHQVDAVYDAFDARRKHFDALQADRQDMEELEADIKIISSEKG